MTRCHCKKKKEKKQTNKQQEAYRGLEGYESIRSRTRESLTAPERKVQYDRVICDLTIARIK